MTLYVIKTLMTSSIERMNHTHSTCTLNWHRSTGHFIRYHPVLRWIQFPHVQEEGLGKGEVGLVLEEAK